jgi:FkbM family methyltransferase
LYELSLRSAPAWIRLLSVMIRRLPVGRYRSMKWSSRLVSKPFQARLPSAFGLQSFYCDLKDHISSDVFFNGQYDPQETALLRAILQPGGTFVDVGANWGFFTLVAAHLVGGDGRVIALEPDPRLFSILDLNIRANQHGHVKALPVAAAATSTTCTLIGFDENSRNFGLSRLIADPSKHRNGFQVLARPLDQVLDEMSIDQVDLMKMDIEGAEGLAINGLTRSLSEGRIDRLMLELHPHLLGEHGHCAYQLMKQLMDYGYQGMDVDHSRETTRRGCYSQRLDPRSLLRPIDLKQPLGEWPHQLWTRSGMEYLP